MRFNVLDKSGHTVTEYAPTSEDLARAEADFQRLTGGEGRAAFALLPGGKVGEPEHVHDFPADAEEVTFILPLVGG